MYKLKKTIVTVICAVFVFSLISGCGDTGKKEEDIPVIEAEEEAEKTEEISETEETEEPESEPKEEVTEEEEAEPESVGTEGDGPEPELVNTEFDMSEVDENGKKFFDCHGNSYLCSEDSKAVYPELAEALIRVDEKVKAAYQENIYNYDDEAKEFAAEQPDGESDWTYYTYSETQLKYSSPRLVSLLRTEFGYLGGAHPDYWYDTVNIDTPTGKTIKLSDLISDQKGLNDILKKKLNDTYPDGNFFDLDESLNIYSLEGDEGTNSAAYDFTLDKTGITFYFGPYDLNSYADGTQEITIGYDELEGVINKDFTDSL